MKILDTNVILRWLLEDDKRKTESFAHLLRRAASGKEQLYVADISIAETVWLLESYYKLSVDVIAHIVRGLLSTDFITFENRERLYESVTIYEDYRVDYIDAYLSALSKEKNVQGILSYDKDFNKVRDLVRSEP